MTHEIESHVGELEALRLKVKDYEEALKFYDVYSSPETNQEAWEFDNERFTGHIPGDDDFEYLAVDSSSGDLFMGKRARTILKKHGALQ
jgi:hypothetical protein